VDVDIYTDLTWCISLIDDILCFLCVRKHIICKYANGKFQMGKMLLSRLDANLDLVSYVHGYCIYKHKIW